MFEYRLVGEMKGLGSGDRELLLPPERPLSYLRVGSQGAESAGVTRALLEGRATEFRFRIPLVMPGTTGSSEIIGALRRRLASPVFPVLNGRRCDDGAEVEVCWLDWVQMKTVGRELDAGFARSDAPVDVGELRITPTFEITGQGQVLLRNWQYWNSEWDFQQRPADRDRWWRVRPNHTRDRPLLPFSSRLRPSSFAPQARGTFAACLHPEMHRLLGRPRYVVIEHPFRTSWLPVLALEDRGLEVKAGNDDGLWRNTIFLDRTARDALGIADGEFCCVHPWLRPRRTIWWCLSRDKLVGSRMIAAHVRAPARADLEKPVCRIDQEALEAIGGRGGERVTIEHLAPAGGIQSARARPESHWKRTRLTQRVLPIVPTERAERARWEAPQLWDEVSNPVVASVGEAPELEGYVDCAERIGVHPPYPTIYLNYYTRRGLKDLKLCQPVQVRVGVPGRLTAEASEFAWLVVIALLGAAIVFVESDTWQIIAAAVLLMLTVWLVAFRAIQAIR